MCLRSIDGGVDRSPFVIHALSAVVEELYFEDRLRIILVGRAFAEVVSVILYEGIFAIFLIAIVLRTEHILQYSESFVVLMTHHQSASIVSSGSSCSGTALCPFTALFASWEQFHSFLEVFLHLVEHFVIAVVLLIESIESGVVSIIGDERRVLIISHEVIIRQTAEEERLTLDGFHLVSHLHIVLFDFGSHEIADIEHVEPFAPRPHSLLISDRSVMIIHAEIVPSL